MEENIHDDKLDDYVRASFEDYEENPSDDMWSRVEEGLLPVAPAPPMRVSLLKYRWQLAAATVVFMLLSLLVCEHVAYEEKLRVLRVQSQTEQRTMSPQTAAPGARPETEQVFEGKSQVSPQALKQDLQNKLTIPFGHQNFEQKPQTDSPGAHQRLNQVLAALDNPAETDQPLAANLEAPKSDATGALPGAFLLSNPAQQTEASIQQKSMLETKGILLEPQMLSGPANRASAMALSLNNTGSPIKRFQGPSGWYLGVQTTFFATREKTRNQVARPGRPLFQNKQQHTDLTAIGWLGFGKKVNTQLSLETGLGYQKSVQTATHAPRFRFGDGIHLGTGKRSFDYEVSTYSGTAEVSLRMDQTLPGNPPADDEPVILTITTRAQTEMLRIPLLARFQWGAGRLQGHVKAGVMGNVLLNNSLELSARVSENAQFRPVDGQDGYTLRLSKPGSISLGYWLSAGASFKVTKHISLVAEPAICGDFARKDQNSRRLPEQVLFGLNVGANYYF